MKALIISIKTALPPALQTELEFFLSLLDPYTAHLFLHDTAAFSLLLSEFLPKIVCSPLYQADETQKEVRNFLNRTSCII